MYLRIAGFRTPDLSGATGAAIAFASGHRARAPYFQALPGQIGKAARRRVERADAPGQGARRQAPVQLCLALVDFGGVAGPGLVLRAGLSQGAGQVLKHVQQQAWTDRGEPRVQLAAGRQRRYRAALYSHHRPRVQTRIHVHDGHAALPVAGFDSALNRRRAAPARQQRAVHVDRAQPRQVQHRGGQDQPVGHHDQRVELQRRHARHGLGIAQARRLQHRQSGLQCQCFDGSGARPLAAPGRAIRLGQHGPQAVAGIDQGGQMARGEVGRAGEGQAQRPRGRQEPSGPQPLGFFQLAANALALERREVVDEQLAVEVVDFVLQANGGQTL